MRDESVFDWYGGVKCVPPQEGPVEGGTPILFMRFIIWRRVFPISGIGADQGAAAGHGGI